MKTQIAVTLENGNIEWLVAGVEEGRFKNRSDGIDDVIFEARRRESTEAIAEAEEKARRLNYAEERAAKAEGAIAAIGHEFGIPTDDPGAMVAKVIQLKRDQVIEGTKKIRADIELQRDQANEALEDIEKRLSKLEEKKEIIESD